MCPCVLSLILVLSTPKYNSIRDRLREHALIEGGGMAPTVGFLGAERVLQRFRGVRGQADATDWKKSHSTENYR